MDQIQKTMTLLTQALGVATRSLPNDRHMAEARADIRRAMQKLEVVSKSQSKKQLQKQTDYQNWWGDVVANAPSAKMSNAAAVHTLGELNAMIAAEQKKIDELESKVQQKINQPSADGKTSVLND